MLLIRESVYNTADGTTQAIRKRGAISFTAFNHIHKSLAFTTLNHIHRLTKGKIFSWHKSKLKKFGAAKGCVELLPISSLPGGGACEEETVSDKQKR